MHTPKAFKIDNQDQMFALIAEHPLATLIVNTSEGLEANHLPLLLEKIDGQHTLIGHIAKANPLHKHIENGSDVLVTFQGPQAYISAGYYPSKQVDGKVVPTWNYTAVHIKGEITFNHDKDELLSIVEKLTRSQEDQREQPWKVSDAPNGYIDTMLKAIVGLRITIDEIQGKWKVSQNHTLENRRGVIDSIKKNGDEKMSRLIDYR
ncbi:MAG: FMN-binding negative transcriptional regulator [Oleiphilaceae bacterium]|nr:FMN-binding negative transcriptional regulator [Oleiphilaceae bacterium]